jgi:hypothetical protein
MGGECGTCGEKGFWLGNLEERDHLEDLGLDGSIIIKGL